MTTDSSTFLNFLGIFMSRPAIAYSTCLSAPRFYVTRNASGQVVDTGSYTAYSEYRMLNKPAAQKTVPRRKRVRNMSTKTVYVTPTGYTAVWARANCGLGPTMFSAKDGSHTVFCDGSGVTNCPGRSPTTLAPPPMFLENQLLTRALNKLRNSNVNFGVMLAESKETARLYEDTARSVSKQVYGYRHAAGGSSLFDLAALNEGRKSWRKVPQSWLELQYGWNPLLQDLYGACQMLDAKDMPMEVQVKARGKWRTSRTVSLAAFIGNWQQTLDISGEMTVRLRYNLSNFVLAKLSQLGLINPLEIAWERVPYSFVVDWFLPIGSWLSALSGDFGYSFVQGSRSTFVRIVERPFGYTSVSHVAGQSSVTGESGYFSRSIYGSSPWPGLYFKSPVSAGHIANASALLVSAFRRGRK